MLGNFVIRDDPRLSNLIANGISTDNETYNPVTDWPQYRLTRPTLLNFNTTCAETQAVGDLVYCVGNPMALRLADAYEWEGGRGRRCDFWKEMGERVPQ